MTDWLAYWSPCAHRTLSSSGAARPLHKLFQLAKISQKSSRVSCESWGSNFCFECDKHAAKGTTRSRSGLGLAGLWASLAFAVAASLQFCFSCKSAPIRIEVDNSTCRFWDSVEAKWDEIRIWEVLRRKLRWPRLGKGGKGVCLCQPLNVGRALTANRRGGSPPGWG